MIRKILKHFLKEDFNELECEINSLKGEINSIRIQTESVESLTMTQFHELLATRRDVLALREANLTKKKKII